MQSGCSEIFFHLGNLASGLSERLDALLFEPGGDLSPRPVLGVDKVLALNVLLERRKRVSVLVLAFVCELGVSDPVRRTTDVLSAYDLRVVAGQILSDPLLRAWRTTDASPSADLHQSLDITCFSLADTLSVRAVRDGLNLRNYQLISRTLGLRLFLLDWFGSGRKLFLNQSFLFVRLSSRYDCLCDNCCSCNELQASFKH